jgi:hypothetical protein
MRLIYVILLIASSFALAQQAPSEDTGIGGAPGGGFRYMDFDRAPNNNVKDINSHSVAINNCQSKGAKIWDIKSSLLMKRLPASPFFAQNHTQNLINKTISQAISCLREL